MTNFDSMPLLDVAQLNTPEALDYFWAHVDDGYFADRAWFYEYVAEECVGVIKLYETTDIQVLDIGCAYGHLLHTLTHLIPDHLYHMIGLDYSPVAIRIANKEFAKYDYDRHLSFYVANVESKKARVAPGYNLVTCIQSLEHMRDWKQALNFIFGMTLETGDVMITIPNGAIDTYPGHVNFWTEDELRDILSEYGEVRSWQFNDGNNLFFHVRKSG